MRWGHLWWELGAKVLGEIQLLSFTVVVSFRCPPQLVWVWLVTWTAGPMAVLTTPRGTPQIQTILRTWWVPRDKWVCVWVSCRHLHVVWWCGVHLLLCSMWVCGWCPRPCLFFELKWLTRVSSWDICKLLSNLKVVHENFVFQVSVFLSLRELGPVIGCWCIVKEYQ